ncbi:MAG: hypothetical protein AAB432_01925 [Patescibacteria group bacterium]
MTENFRWEIELIKNGFILQEDWEEKNEGVKTDYKEEQTFFGDVDALLEALKEKLSRPANK